MLTLSWLYKIFFILQSSQMCPFPKGHDFAKCTQHVCFLKVFYFFKRTYPKLSLQTFQISLHFQKLWKQFWKLSPQKTHSLTFKKYPQSLKCTRKNVLNSQKMTSVTPMSSLSRCKTQIGPHKDRSTAHTQTHLPHAASVCRPLRDATINDRADDRISAGGAGGVLWERTSWPEVSSVCVWACDQDSAYGRAEGGTSGPRWCHTALHVCKLTLVSSTP